MQKTVQETLNKQLLRRKPTAEQFTAFTEALRNLKDSIQPNETEEHNKNYIQKFLCDAFYGNTNLVNTAGYIDCAIYQTKDANSPIDVIIEAKAPNSNEFPSRNNLNCKAMQELVLYFMRQRFQKKNITLKHLIATNGFEWFFIDASEFEKYFAADKKFEKLYREYDNKELLFSGTKDFYAEIAKPKIDQVKQNINFVYIDIRALKTESEKLRMFRMLQPAHLLKQFKFADSNKLNTAFYNELLHIIGLEEHKIKGKNVIERKEQNNRDEFSLLEDAIYQLEDYNLSEEETFDVALNLVITWINRILFLKLLESQLISYHGQKTADQYRFLEINIIKNFDQLNELFFKVLASPIEQRSPQVKDKFIRVPYLNSSLFEMTSNEKAYFRITGLTPGEMPLYTRTVLKDVNGHPMKMKMDTLEYLFRFLDAYDFGSEQSDDITQSENKTLINASVLGLIFEKINGYKDGSFFTPGFITQYMCREAIESTVIQKFNEHFGFACKTLTDIHNQDFDKHEAIAILDGITLCDPAVGSGHFLVSALNCLIAIRAELGLLYDENGKRLKDYTITIDNDELMVLDEDGEIFHYNPNSAESQRVQKTLFDLKRYIIENNLFGADINPNSVNICRLRLWIELLKNAYYKEAGKLETLPNIDINIKCGNSLISHYMVRVDLYGGMNDKARGTYIQAYKTAVQEYKKISNKEQKQKIIEQIGIIKSKLLNSSSQLDLFEQKQDSRTDNERNITPLEWMIEFPEVLNDEGVFKGFDIIIGNPPYIEAKKLKSQSSALKAAKYRVYSGTADLSVYFIELALRLLKPSGRLYYITTNKFFNTEFGLPVRRMILEKELTHLINFEQVEVFENVLVSSVILGVINQHPISDVFKYHQFFQLNNEQIKQEFITQQNSFGSFAQSNLDESAWSFSTGVSANLKRKLSALPIIKNINGLHVYRGVTTGYNPAFIISNEQREELIARDPRNAEIIKNMLQGRNIRKWYYNESDENLIFTRKGINISEYPVIEEYLSSFYEQLKPKKNSDDEEGRKPGSYKWYEILDNTAYYSHFERAEKIIWALTADKWAYTLDTEQHYLPSNAYILTSDSLPIRFILGLLNSEVLHQYFKYIGVMTAGGAYTLKAATIEALPIPDSTPEQQQPIIDLVDAILAARRQDPQADTASLEAQIDALVYQLYDLTPDEIALIKE